WCAIAIHDTSSVVGAAAAYGSQALEVATTVKLARALWIVPVAIATAMAFKQKGVKITIPYFIFGFILAMLFNTFAPAYVPAAKALVSSRAGRTARLHGAGQCGRGAGSGFAALSRAPAPAGGVPLRRGGGTGRQSKS
nr:hypothetical protein [Tanacetum cinerariifolium]